MTALAVLSAWSAVFVVGGLLFALVVMLAGGGRG